MNKKNPFILMTSLMLLDEKRIMVVMQLKQLRAETASTVKAVEDPETRSQMQSIKDSRKVFA
ncbi:rCG60419 [Rattus norvegicus]|uniref:RCG60419 n=1 Tax=Rattus norvegicus TaxID=10116 RepID=A6KKC2_RAT|nr:rCG60419 [Rattus norvegicus]